MQKGNKENNIDEIIFSYALKAGIGGAIPLPIMDIGAVAYYQLKMLEAICKAYDLSYSHIKKKIYVDVVLASISSKYTASFIKSIPVIGGLIGIASMSMTSTVTTLALGKVFKKICSEYEFSEELDLEEFKSKFEQEYHFCKNTI